MLLFKLFEPGQLLGHNVQVNAIGGVLGDEPGQETINIIKCERINTIKGDKMNILNIASSSELTH